MTVAFPIYQRPLFQAGKAELVETFVSQRKSLFINGFNKTD